jgi:hypothetical protein
MRRTKPIFGDEDDGRPELRRRRRKHPARREHGQKQGSVTEGIEAEMRDKTIGVIQQNAFN